MKYLILAPAVAIWFAVMMPIGLVFWTLCFVMDLICRKCRHST